MTDGHLPWYRRLSLRSRMVLITAGLVTVVLALGGVLLLFAVRSALVEAAVEAGELRAADVAGLAATGRLPALLPAVDEVESVLQVVSDGRVVSSTTTGSMPVVDGPGLPPGAEAVLSLDRLPVEDDEGPFRVVARGVRTPTGDATVYVAVSVEELEEAVAVQAALGAVALPVLVILLSAVMWVVLGRTLAPVEAIRRRADAISARRLDRRVPEPAQHDEIGRLARTVNAMLARLQDSAQRQQRFVADAAHELRSPVTSLRAQLETAGDSPGERIDEALRADLLNETQRMQNLVEQLLVLARTDGAGRRGRRVVLDLDEAVEAAVVAAGGSGRHVAVDVSAVRPVQIAGDPDLVEQMVRNLVDNAVRHARREVVVTLVCDDACDEAVLTVDDDGPGIGVDRREAVFERFTRLEDARDRDSGGAGLGLAIVADVVREHRGRVDVTDSPAGGARFQVHLPVGSATGRA
jgi:signal transduction histidine kinase